MLPDTAQVSVQRGARNTEFAVFQDCRKRMLGNDIEWWVATEASRMTRRW